jgi:hypothetical protein
MIDRTPVDWLVPRREWHAFIDYVREEFGEVEGYLGREAEMAMREYADEDRYHSVEETVDRLVQAAGRSPSDLGSDEKIRDLDTDDKERVQVRVDEQIKDEFREVAADANDPYGVVFAHALCEYRDGGRAGRMERKLDRVADDAEAVLSEIEDGSESGTSVRQRRTIAICDQLKDDGFRDEELVEAITKVVGNGTRPSQPTIEDYRERIIDRLDLEPNPFVEQNPSKGRVWMPADRVAEIAPDGQPRVARLPVEMLSREERIRRLRLELGHLAAQSKSGNARVTASAVRTDVFDGELTTSETVAVMQAAANEAGFTFDQRSNPAVLKVNLAIHRDADSIDIKDEVLLEDLLAYRDSDASGLIAASNTSATDWTAIEHATEGVR